MRLSLVTGPEGEPIGATEAIAHLRLEPDTEEDQLLNGLLAVAREYAEAQTGRQFLTATWKLTLDRFPRCSQPMALPLPPLQSVTWVKYLDAAGVQQTWSSGDYVVDKPQGPRCLEGRVYPALNKIYPDTAYREDAVEVQYVAGYGDQSKVPTALKQAMLLLIGHWYEQREAVVVGQIPATVPLTVDALLAPYYRMSEAVR